MFKKSDCVFSTLNLKIYEKTEKCNYEFLTKIDQHLMKELSKPKTVLDSSYLNNNYFVSTLMELHFSKYFVEVLSCLPLLRERTIAAFLSCPFTPLPNICLKNQCRPAYFMLSIMDGSQSFNCPMDEEKNILSLSHETGDSKTQRN